MCFACLPIESHPNICDCSFHCSQPASEYFLLVDFPQIIEILDLEMLHRCAQQEQEIAALNHLNSLKSLHMTYIVAGCHCSTLV